MRLFNYAFVISFLLLFGCKQEQSAEKTEATKSIPKTEESKTQVKVDQAKYYGTYSGHDIEDLEKVYEGLKNNGCTNFIFYAGDSSLDNKHWFQDKAAAINGYEKILVPPEMKEDIDYWLTSSPA